MQQYFPCPTCGAYNLVGSASCSTCCQQLYYNCPYCGTWVDNRYIDCPYCHKKLCWPGSLDTYDRVKYVPSHSYAKKKKTGPWPAILVSLFIICLVALLFTQPSSSIATKTDTIAVPQTGTLGSDSQAKITVSSPNGQTSLSPEPSLTPSPSTDSSTYLSGDVNLTTSSGEIIGTQMPDAAGNSSTGGYTDSTGYTPKRSAYAEQMWPNWGHCNNGSCQACTQQ